MLGVVVAVLAMAGGAAASDDERGWAFLIEKLVHDGVPRDRVLRVFRDDRVDEFDGLQFSLQPRESPALYRHLRTHRTAGLARRCLDRYDGAFDRAERRFGVPSQVVAAIIQVESGCGANTGHSRIMPALARLAMAAEPANLERNIVRLSLLNPKMPVAGFARWRAQHLEDMFYPEVKATFEVADRLRIDPLEIRGSGSGAFGIPQFLPHSYLRYGVDGDGDGHVSLYDAGDAIPSCAHYLQEYGWKAGLSRKEQRNVIWGYNHSDAYIDTVLWIADEVKSPTPEPVVKKAKATGRRGKRASAKSTRASVKSTRQSAKSTRASTKSGAAKTPRRSPK
jgi:membrane-bound lytic murein transglycosylase B